MAGGCRSIDARCRRRRRGKKGCRCCPRPHCPALAGRPAGVVSSVQAQGGGRSQGPGLGLPANACMHAFTGRPGPRAPTASAHQAAGQVGVEPQRPCGVGQRPCQPGGRCAQLEQLLLAVRALWELTVQGAGLELGSLDAHGWAGGAIGGCEGDRGIACRHEKQQECIIRSVGRRAHPELAGEKRQTLRCCCCCCRRCCRPRHCCCCWVSHR